MPRVCGVRHPMVPFDPVGEWVLIVAGVVGVGDIGKVEAYDKENDYLHVLVLSRHVLHTQVKRSDCKLMVLVDVPDKIREACPATHHRG